MTFREAGWRYIEVDANSWSVLVDTADQQSPYDYYRLPYWVFDSAWVLENGPADAELRKMPEATLHPDNGALQRAVDTLQDVGSGGTVPLIDDWQTW